MQFMQPDTIIPDITSPQSLNRYSYVTNRPINFNDPTGHNEECGIGESGCSAGTYTPPPDQSGSLDRVLKKYGITTEGGTREQKYAALRGAYLVGRRLSTVYGDTPEADNFYKVHGDIHIVFGANSGGVCKTNTGTITCGTGAGGIGANQDKYWLQTLVHEYAHVFDARYQSLSHWDDAACGTNKSDCLASDYLPNEYYLNAKGYLGNGTFPYLAHDSDVPGYNRSEAYADMYMNFVLHGNGLNGFDLETSQGQGRYNWMLNADASQPMGIFVFMLYMGKR
jgi:hypothetical protein